MKLLLKYRDDEGFRFAWPLIADFLPICDAAIAAEALEIRLPCSAIESIRSFAKAKRRIYLTATLDDDTVLCTHFGADVESIREPITPKSADDLGDRMILTPLMTHPNARDEDIRDLLVAQSREHNVVVIVPSRRRAEFWRPVADSVLDGKTLADGVARLGRGNVGLVVLLNKYDGVDLPHAACRILALDGLPEAYGALDRLDAVGLDESDAMVTQQIQRIEQGMGRGVRSNEDYCVVLLLGSRLTQRLYAQGGNARFSPATRAQLDLSPKVADMRHGTSVGEIVGAIAQCLNRDADWVAASRRALDG